MSHPKSAVKAARRFTVPGHAVGYYTQGARPNWTRLKAYHAYKKAVQLAAVAAGLTLPLEATEAAPVIIWTQLYSEKRIHHDCDSIHKGIVDALFYRPPKRQGEPPRKGARCDKHTGGRFDPAIYGDGDRVEVIIEFRRRKS